MSARVIKVIETKIERRGSGEDMSSPIRVITQYWSEDGDLLAEVDPMSRVVPVEEEVRAVREARYQPFQANGGADLARPRQTDSETASHE